MGRGKSQLTDVALWFRWRWNTFRYWAGLTCLSPAAHEFRRMMKGLGYKEVK